jgi:hypothetical protein
MKILKVFIIAVFAASMVPTIVMQKATPIPVRLTACASLTMGIVVGLVEIARRRKPSKVMPD